MVLVFNNKFKVATTPNTATLEYYQSIYTHCKQRFNISNGIEVVKKSVYQYIENHINNNLFGNYNISKVRNNLYNNLVHYSQLGTEDLNSETLATYFQKLNFNIIEYCEEKYSVQSKYSFDFKSETETSNKGKQRLKQYSKTTPNTPTIQKTPAKHLQTPEQGTSVKLPLSITSFPISLVQPQTPNSLLNCFSRPEDFQSPRNPTQQQKPISTSANIIDYLQENESNYSESLESEETESKLEEITENEEEMATAYIAKIPEFTSEDNDTSPQEWLDKVQKAGDANGWIAARMLKAIPYFLQGTAEEWFENLEEPFENWQAFKDTFLQQFTDNNTSITLRNCFHNIKQKTSETFIAELKDKLIKKVCPHAPADLATAIRHAKSYEMAMEEANHTKLVNFAIGETSSTAEEKIDQLTKKPYQTPPTQQYQVPARKLVQHNQFTPQNQLQNNHNRINPNNQLVFRNSDIFPFEFKANESPFLLSNAAVNEQKAITAIYTEATVEGKPIRLILDSESARSIIIYQLMQQLKQNVDRPAQTVIVTADSMKKTPVGEINDFPFSIDGITISVKVLVMDAPQYQALVRNDWLLKTNANLNWETQELKISYQGQYTIVPATCGIFNKRSKKAPVFEFEEEKEMPLTETYMALGSTSNWAEETEQEIFEESRGWKKVRYSTSEPQKQPPYIPLKCKDCNKKLSSMGACISPEEEYETRICYFYKACHREQLTTTPDTTTLKYYQSIYTYCKQRFNIPDEIEVVKKSVYQYIENRINNYLFGNYNISEVRSNLYNNLAYYSQLGTEDLNSETLATYFHELNFNIIKYCEKTYPVQSQYFINFELKTETSNKGKNKLKQYSKTTPNTLTLLKTTAKHLQTPEQETSSKLPLTITPFPALLAQAQTPNLPLNQFTRPEDFTLLRSPIRQQKSFQTSSNLLDFLAENQSEHSETAANEKNEPEISEEESINSENEKDEMTTYITKIPEFNGEDIETSPQEWLNQFENLVTPFNDWNAFKAAFLEQFTDNNTSITLRNHFQNIKQEPSESVITYIGKFNKLLRQICQLETNNYYSNAQILYQFITGLKDKLIKKICPHAPEDLNFAIQHAKRYKMAIEEANCTKLVNLAIRETSSVAEEKIDQLTKKVKNYFTNQQQQQPQKYQLLQRQNQNNFALLSNNQSQNCHYSYYPPRPQYQNNYYQPTPQPIQQQYQQPPTQYYQVPARRLSTQNQFTPQNQYQVNNNRISSNNQLVSQNSTQPRPNHYHTQPSYLKMSKEQNFYHTAPLEGRAAFEANELPFLLSNAAANKQKAITAMYTKAEVEGKTICLILDSGSTKSIITYQLMQQLKKNVDRPAQTVIVTANGMKKTPVGEIDNFPFTFNGIIIPVKVLLTISYQGQHAWVPATCGTFNKCSEKAPAFEFEPEEEKPLIKTFMALGSTSNWADKMEQEHFTPHSKPKTSG
ncbi:hypothetical protein G9A89_016783 [Geosiphon pyriformis]|nr:hypothetical protein G9A89_016783 [Geosiphon pyriformis]